MIKTFVAALAALVVATACSSGPTIRANTDPTADFSRYSTYAFSQPLTTDRGGTRSVLSTFLVDATNREMRARGYQVDNQNPDLLIDFFVATKQRVSGTTQPTYTMGMGMGRGGMGRGTMMGMGMSTTTVRTTTVGTLSVALADVSDRRMIWEASASGTVNDKVQNNLQSATSAAIEDIFRRFPVQPPTQKRR